jgi:ubiquinone/menaquinone biosynthesis C-methylase UbiE
VTQQQYQISDVFAMQANMGPDQYMYVFWVCRYLVESIRKFPDKIAFAEMIQDAGFRGVDYETLAAGGVAIHWGFKL